MNETSTVATATTQGPGRGTAATSATPSPTGERVGEVASTVADQAREVADRARDEAGEVARRAGDQIRSTADDQARRISETLGSTASELRTMAERSDRPDGAVASLARDGADRLERWGRTLDDRGWEGMVAEAQRTARRRPGTFLAGCFVAGLVAGRFVRNDQGGAMQARSEGAEDPSAPGWANGAMGPDPVTAWASTGASAGEAAR